MRLINEPSEGIVKAFKRIIGASCTFLDTVPVIPDGNGKLWRYEMSIWAIVADVGLLEVQKNCLSTLGCLSLNAREPSLDVFGLDEGQSNKRPHAFAEGLTVGVVGPVAMSAAPADNGLAQVEVAAFDPGIGPDSSRSLVHGRLEQKLLELIFR